MSDNIYPTWRPGNPRPDRHPFRPSESPVFLPGDKVRDGRDTSGKVWRVVSRVADWPAPMDDEMIRLRRVDDPTDVREVIASRLTPHLVMVAPSKNLQES